MDHNTSKIRYWYCLLPVFLGLILLVQAGSADLTLDLSIPKSEVFLGSTVTIYCHVYDPDYPGVVFSNAVVPAYTVSDTGEFADLGCSINASGWGVRTYTPQTTGKYTFTGLASVNYSTIPGLPAIGKQTDGNFVRYNVTNLSYIPHNTIPQHVLLVTTATAPATTTPVPVVTTTNTALQTTQVTQATQATPVTQAPPAPQTSVAVPALQRDTTPPVTTLTLAGSKDGSGGYSSDVICTLTAADNPGGSGVSVIQYSFDGTSWNTYRQPFPIDKTGPMVLYYRSSDNAGNTEVANVKAIAIGSPGAAQAGTPAAQAPGTAPAMTTSADAIPFFPLPLWLVALILFVIIAAVGGALYLESQQKKEGKK